MRKHSTARALAALGFMFVYSGCAHEAPPNGSADGGGVFDPVPADKYGVNVNSDPQGGHVSCRDLRSGEEVVTEEEDLLTPSQLLMPRPSDYRVTVTLVGRMPATRDVMENELALGEAVAVNLTLAPMPDGCCAVSVASNPQGHEIYVDGVDQSEVTPKELTLSEGSHRILAANPGFRGWIWEGTVSNGLSITLPVGRDLEGTWNPEGDTPGGVIEITMESTPDKILAHLGFDTLVVSGDTLSENGTEDGDGQVLDDGNMIDFTITYPEGSDHYRYRKQ